MMESEDFDLEEVYDTEIAPLMTRIIEICKHYKMPMVASFCYKSDDDGEDFCSTYIEHDNRTIDTYVQMYNCLMKREDVFSITVVTKTD